MSTTIGTKSKPYRSRKGKDGKVKTGRSRAFSNRGKHSGKSIYYQNADGSIHSISSKMKKEAKRKFFRVRKDGSKGGLKKSQLTPNKRGIIVSKAKSKLGKKNQWIKATMKARRQLGITKFQLVKKGTQLYKKAMEIFRKEKKKGAKKK